MAAKKRDQRKKYTAESAATKALNPATIANLTEAEAKRAYNELRSIAQRRITALAHTDYFNVHSSADIPFTDAPSQMPPGMDVYSELPALVEFIRSGPSVTRERQKEESKTTKRIANWLKEQAEAEGETLAERQATAKAKAMGRFFDAMYDEFGDKSHTKGSPVIMDMWEDLNSIGYNVVQFSRSKNRIKEAFELWSENKTEFARIARGDIENKAFVDSEDEKKLKQLKKELDVISTPKKRKKKSKVVKAVTKTAKKVKRTVKKVKRTVKRKQREKAKAAKAKATKKKS